MQYLDIGALFTIPNLFLVLQSILLRVDTVIRGIINTFRYKFEPTVPNYLSLFRTAAGPLIFCLFLFRDRITYFEGIWISTYVFACFTDWLDGYLARKYPDQASEFGKIIDPVADKVLVISMIATIYYFDKAGQFELCLMVFIIFRELAVNFMRKPFIGDVNLLSVAEVGKVKAGFQMVALGIVLGRGGITSEYLGQSFNVLGYQLLFFATILTAISGWIYLMEWIRQLKMAPRLDPEPTLVLVVLTIDSLYRDFSAGWSAGKVARRSHRKTISAS